MKKMLEEFKTFIMRGNVLDLAVGVVMGGAFSKIVSSLVNDIMMPFLGVIIGGLDFSNLSITFRNAKIMYGSFIQNIIDFLIISFCIFMYLKELEKKSEEPKKTSPSEEILLLREIRDELKSQKKTSK